MSWIMQSTVILRTQIMNFCEVPVFSIFEWESLKRSVTRKEKKKLWIRDMQSVLNEKKNLLDNNSINIPGTSKVKKK